MKILTMRKNNGQFIPLKVKHKCLCGTKVLIEDTMDISFIRKGYIDVVAIVDGSKFGYTCPNCEQLCVLSDWENFVVRNKIKKACNIDKYESICDNIRDDVELYGFREAFDCNDNQSLIEFLVERGIKEKMRYVIDNGLPVPFAVKELMLSGDLIID